MQIGGPGQTDLHQSGLRLNYCFVLSLCSSYFTFLYDNSQYLNALKKENVCKVKLTDETGTIKDPTIPSCKKQKSDNIFICPSKYLKEEQKNSHVRLICPKIEGNKTIPLDCEKDSTRAELLKLEISRNQKFAQKKCCKLSKKKEEKKRKPERNQK